MPDTFQCTLVTPQEQLLDGAVTYASLPAWDGQIGIAPSRAPLMVKLGQGALRLDFVEGGSRWFFLGGGFAQMKDDRLSLLTDEAIPAEQIVREEARAALEKAQGLSAHTQEDVSSRQRQIERAKALQHLLELHANRL